MIAYKFRGVSALDHTLDILINNRLYCANWRDLNDPMEGIFEYSSRGDRRRRQELEMIRDHKLRYRVCSLSRIWNSPLLWAHYADGFKGLAIEVELPDPIDIHDPAFNPLGYNSDALLVDLQYRQEWAFSEVDQGDEPLTLAQRILCSKHEAWRYEEEVRILSREAFFNVRGRIRSVVLGPRASPGLVDLVRLALGSQDIEISTLAISAHGLRREPWIAPGRQGRLL